jgi:hypothetical protein
MWPEFQRARVARHVLNKAPMWIVAPLVCMVAIIVSFLPDPRERPSLATEASTARWTWGLPVVATAIALATIIGAVS